jgi:hypothetical protein
MYRLTCAIFRPVSAGKVQQTQIPWTDYAMQNALRFPENPPEGLYSSDILSYGIDHLVPSYRPFSGHANKDGSRLPSDRD